MSEALLNIKALEYASKAALQPLGLPDDTCMCHFDVVPVPSELLFKGKVFYDDKFIGWVYFDENEKGEVTKRFKLET